MERVREGKDGESEGRGKMERMRGEERWRE